MTRAGLDRVGIVLAAMALLDERGLGGLTARALGERLGVRASALYHHLPDMQALQDELATALLREMAGHPIELDGWEALLRGLAARTRRVLTAHRDGARVFAGTRITDDGLLATMEAPLAVLTSAGLALDEAFWTMQSVLHFTVGFVIEEQHRRDDEPDAYRAEQRLARINAEAAPLTASATAPMLEPADRQFAYGVDLLVAGVAVRLAAPAD